MNDVDFEKCRIFLENQIDTKSKNVIELIDAYTKLIEEKQNMILQHQIKKVFNQK